MDFTRVEKYLTELGAKDLELRASLTNPDSTVQERKTAIEAVDKIEVLIKGYTMAIKHLTGSIATAEHYQEFYDQARSAEGIKNRL